MHMFHSASLKLGLERAVLSQNREQNGDGEESGKSSKKSDREAQAKEIDELLKKGAYDVFRDEDDREAETFMESDIDQLLERRSKTVSYGASATSSLGGGLGSFSKASFVAETEDGAKDVDLDDPDFWAKAIGLEVQPEENPEDVAAMLDDGIKRNRKQVQQYDPYAETAMAEQMKKDKIALEKLLEKEEKERQLAEKKLKKKKSNEERKKNRDEQSNIKKDETEGVADPKISSQSGATEAGSKVPKVMKDSKQKKTKKGDRARALRRAEDENPLIERFKQAWEIPQRNRATAATVRFGFDRFCKLRSESNLTSLPLQDLEIFVRAYFYQLALQAAATILRLTHEDTEMNGFRALIQEWLSVRLSPEVDWICDSIHSVMRLQTDVRSGRKFLRLPQVLTEPTFVADLRYGAAFRALRRVGLLSRLNSFIGHCLDTIISSLGPEELGRRGCSASELSSLDVDLKARFVTSEELSFAISNSFQKADLKVPAMWWNRSCDVALVIGTFVHGAGNYELMRKDPNLPFGDRILGLCSRDPSFKVATLRFRAAVAATVRVFEDALEAGRMKAEAEVQAAVAAAAKAAHQREVDAALLRKGGAEAEAAVRNMPDTQVDDAFEFDGTDSHFVTLPRIYEFVQESLRNFSAHVSADERDSLDDAFESFKSDDEMRANRPTLGRVKEHHLLSMPDARILDYRLSHIMNELERTSLDIEGEDGPMDSVPSLWPMSNDVRTIFMVRNNLFPKFHTDTSDLMNEYAGVGLGGNQCGISHRTLNDGSDFSFGSASSQISMLAYGTDAPRYLRALAVPMNVTRFAISGMIYAEPSFVKEVMESERLRYFGRDEVLNDSRRSQSRPRKFTKSDPQHEEQTHGDSGALTSRPTNDASATSTAEAGQHISARPKVIEPVDPVELIDRVFRASTKLRATICVAVAFNGFPSLANEPLEINGELWAALCKAGVPPSQSPSGSLFDATKFREAVASLDSSLDVPDIDALRKYVDHILLPHCLRLCVSGNGPATRNARGSHGDYETAFGVSVHPEPSRPHPCPLPDPCLCLQDHSLQAVGMANAMLRRVRLLRSSVHLCSLKSEVPLRDILDIAKSSAMGHLDDWPVWWCPWIHDVALMFHAATGGLFSVLADRSASPIFSQSAVLEHIHSRCITGRSNFHLSSSEMSEWTRRQADSFPSVYQIERRLGLLCGLATVDVDSEVRFDFIPMFDHGGWPRN
jgi:hypothetical protein